MWLKIADFITHFRVALLIILAIITAFMGYKASQVEMSYDFTNAIPTDNPKYQDYQNFLDKFGNDGNTMMLGLQSEHFFEADFFNAYSELSRSIARVKSVDAVLDVPHAVYIHPDSTTKLAVDPLFTNETYSARELDSLGRVFLDLPFYKGLLYNPETKVYLMAITIDKGTLASKDRTRVINELKDLGDAFGAAQHTEIHYSGLPLIRTEMANKVQFEVRLFLILSLLLTATILMVFFRSWTSMLVSMIVVGIGVVWSFGTLTLLGYKITLLTGMIPPLIVVIGIPNCVYFLNKYHMEYGMTANQIESQREMVNKMGIVTLFTNLTSAIGFGVFAFTKSVILKEFGLVAGLNILGLFVVSLILIPAVFSFLKPPSATHTGYLDNKWLNKILDDLVVLAFRFRKAIYVVTLALVGLAFAGIIQLKAVGHIVDDLPHSNVIYKDLKFFETNFKGVMPLEILVDTRKRYGALDKLQTWQKVDELTQFLEEQPEVGEGLTLTKGVKFARQGLMGGGSDNYQLPSSIEFGGLKPYLISTLRKNRDSLNSSGSAFAQIARSFVDTSLQVIRLSVRVADIGSVEMPQLLNRVEHAADSIFGDGPYDLTYTGTSITFLEGSRFIIKSLRDSLILAFGMILLCMIFLFRDWRIVLVALTTNLIPIILTAGIMGWAHVPLKPSTVLVFSVALGITVDVTIRFLVNFKQDLEDYEESVRHTVRRTIHDTGLSIIFTSVVLIIGFGVFAISEFQGTKSLGVLTSLTLFLAMIFNLTLQPALLLWMDKSERRKALEEKKAKQKRPN